MKKLAMRPSQEEKIRIRGLNTIFSKSYIKTIKSARISSLAESAQPRPISKAAQLADFDAFNLGCQIKKKSKPLMQALSPREGLFEIFGHFNQNPLSILCHDTIIQEPEAMLIEALLHLFHSRTSWGKNHSHYIVASHMILDALCVPSPYHQREQFLKD